MIDFDIGIVVVILMFLLPLFPLVATPIDYYSWKHYEDDGEPIKHEQDMIIHCDVVHDDIGLYQTLNCAICIYSEECEKYRHRHDGKTPIEVLRENGRDRVSRRGKQDK